MNIYIFNIKVYKIEDLNTLPTIYYTALQGNTMGSEKTTDYPMAIKKKTHNIKLAYKYTAQY